MDKVIIDRIDVSDCANYWFDRCCEINRECSKYRTTLQEIREIVSEPCIADENCQTCNSGCMQKDILAKINEVIGVEE